MEQGIRVRNSFLTSSLHLFSEDTDRSFRHLELAQFLLDEHQAGARSVSYSREWRTFCEDIGRLCLRLGSPSVVYKPQEDIATLRHHLVTPKTPSRESELRELRELQAKVDEQKEQLFIQQRIITNLSFRHVLEALPGPKPTGKKGKPAPSSTAQWQNFWEKTCKNAQTQKSSASGSSPSHPLEPLLAKYGFNLVKNVGDGLYGTLSTNIHHYSGEYKIIDHQWDKLPGDILKAIIPTQPRREDGSVDWNSEKERFVQEEDNTAST